MRPVSDQIPGERVDPTGLPSRESALALLHEFTQKPGLLAHARAVEAALRAYAPRFQGEVEAWGLVGLLHDFDYERWPTQEGHPYRGAQILEVRGYPEWFRRAILSHVDGTGVLRETSLEHALFACDELSGFLVACALVMPDRSLHAVRIESVRKRLRSKGFAAGVDREAVERGAAEIGLELDEHIANLLTALQKNAGELGLDGWR